MAWQDITIPMLRVLINDMAETPTYSDDTLTQLILVSSMYVVQDVDFDVAYSIDIVNQTITPDPSPDTIFTNFIVMKAACQADISTYRTKALMDGISARCGPAALSVLGNAKGFKELLTIGPCAAYGAMINDYVFGTGQLCKAILSPFTGNNFDPESLAGTPYDVRGHGNYYT